MPLKYNTWIWQRVTLVPDYETPFLIDSSLDAAETWKRNMR